MTIYLYNIVIPLLVGFLLYYIFSPDVLFVRFVDSWMGCDFHFFSMCADSFLFRFLRNHLMDFLWAYALTFSIFLLIGNNTVAILQSVFWIAFCFSTFLEILQYTSFVPGTFDALDILTEFIGIACAVFIISCIKINHAEEETLYER